MSASVAPFPIKGQLVLTNAAGETAYQQAIHFNDLDDYAKNADELGRHIHEILKKISEPGG